MAAIKVIIIDPTGSKKVPVELPDDVAMKRLIPALVTKMSLPTTQGGQPLKYELDHKRSGKRLGDEDTLQAAGVQPEDTLILLPSPTAGAGATSPRLRRLQSDYERLQRLAAQSDLIRIAAADGNPPEKYVIEFTCRGVERLQGGSPVYRSHHQMGILLTAGYPTTKPGLRFLTPIFHPNILSEGEVCIGPWYASKWLDELVFMVAEMIQYKIPPTRETREDVLNPHAVTWLLANKPMLPVDNREVKSTGDIFDLIKIGDSVSSSSPDSDVLDMIKITL